MALVILDRQHVGVPARGWADVGAWGDFDRDGQKDVVEQEAILTARYLLPAEIRLRELGHHVVVLSDGSYADRHARARSYRADVYVAAHLNAGGGDYGLAIWDHRSTAGPELAGAVMAELGKTCPELRRTKAFPGKPDDWTSRAYSCIEGVYAGRPVGICYEPAFLDTASHRGLFTDDGLGRIGRALADGVHAYLQGRGT